MTNSKTKIGYQPPANDEDVFSAGQCSLNEALVDKTAERDISRGDLVTQWLPYVNSLSQKSPHFSA